MKLKIKKGRKIESILWVKKNNANKENKSIIFVIKSECFKEINCLF